MVYDSIQSYTFYNVQHNQFVKAVFSPFCANIDSTILFYDSATHIDSIKVTAPNCRWQAVSNVPWLQIINVKNSGTTFLKFSIQANTDTVNRIAQLTIGNKIVYVQQFVGKKYFFVDIITNKGGTINVANNNVVNGDSTFVLRYTPFNNFKLDSVWLNGKYFKDSTQQFTIPHINNHYLFKIKFSYAPTTKFLNIQNGNINPVNIQIKPDTTIRFSYYPDSGYTFDYVIANGVINRDSTTHYTLRNINYDSRLSVYFKPIGNTITVTKKYNGINKIDSVVTIIYPDSIEYNNNILKGADFFRKNNIQAIDSNKIYFNGINKDTALKIGTVLTDSNSSMAPRGLFRKIVGFDTVGGNLVANTVPADITEVVKNGRITGSGVFTPDNLFAIDTNILKNQTLNINGAVYKITNYKVNGILDYTYTKEDDFSYIKIPINFSCQQIFPAICNTIDFRLEGFVLINANYKFSIDIELSNIKKIELIYSLKTIYDIKLGANLSFHGELPIPPLATVSTTPQVLSFGIKIPEYIPQFNIQLGIKLNLDGAIYMRREGVSSVSKKITYTRDCYLCLPHIDVVDLQPPYHNVISDTIQAQVEAGITPYLSLGFLWKPLAEASEDDVKKGMLRKSFQVA